MVGESFAEKTLRDYDFEEAKDYFKDSGGFMPQSQADVKYNYDIVLFIALLLLIQML